MNEKSFFRMTLSDHEKSLILKPGAITSARTTVIARALISVCEEGVEITRGREALVDTAIKRRIIQKVYANRRAKRAHIECADNYTHTMILYWLKMLRWERGL